MGIPTYTPEELAELPSEDEVRQVIKAIIDLIDRTPEPKGDPRWCPPRKTLVIPDRPPIIFSQEQVDAAKALARKELGEVAVDVDSERVSENQLTLQRNELAQKPARLPQEQLPL